MIFDETETSQEDTTEKIKITAENFDDVLTSGGSISIEKYEIDESELSYSAKKAINYSNYSLLKFADKHTLFDELKLREDTMLSCEKFGLTIKESYPYAIIMQRMDSDMAYAVQLIRNFKSEKVALDETQKYSKGRFKYAFLSEEDVKNSFIELLAKGNTFDDILNAYAVSCALDIDIKDALINYKDGSSNFKVNEEKIVTKMLELGIIDMGVATLAETGDGQEEDEYNEYLKGPFNKKDNSIENVDVKMGTLGYTDGIVSISGKNGMDLNLAMVYSVDNIRLLNRNENTFGIGWNLNFTRLGRKEELKFNRAWYPDFISVGSGGEYEIQQKLRTGEEKLKILGYKIHGMSIEQLENSEVKNACYVVTYEDQVKEYFNAQGRFLQKIDRFGNKITCEYEYDGKGYNDNNIVSMKITGTNDEQVIVTKESKAGYIYVTYNLPNGDNVVYKYEDSKMVLLKERIDTVSGKSYSTKFEYDAFLDRYDTTRGIALLKSITFPTGLKAVYEYEEYSNEGDSFYRVTSRKDEFDGKVYNQKTYTYSQSNFAKNDGGCFTVTENDSLTGETIYEYVNGSNKKITHANKVILKTYNLQSLTDRNPNPNAIYTYEGDKVTKEYFTYERNRILNSWSPISSIGKELDIKTNKDYKDSIAYSSKYKIPIQKRYRTGKNDNIKEYYDLSDDEKSVIRKRVYQQNRENLKYELKGYSTYEYDEFGEIVSSKDYIINTSDDGEYKQGHTITGDYVETRYDRVKKNENGKPVYVVTITKGSGKTAVENVAKYDILWRKIEETDGNGNVTKYEYNSYGNVTKVINPDNTEIRNTYDYQRNILTRTDENGHSSEFGYDKIGNLISVKDISSKNVIQTREYDAGYRLIGKVTGSKIKNAYTYDIENRVTEKNIQDLIQDLSQSNVVYNEKNVYSVDSQGSIISNAVFGENDITVK